MCVVRNPGWVFDQGQMVFSTNGAKCFLTDLPSESHRGNHEYDNTTKAYDVEFFMFLIGTYTINARFCGNDELAFLHISQENYNPIHTPIIGGGELNILRNQLGPRP